MAKRCADADIIMGCSPNCTDSCHQCCLCSRSRRPTLWYRCSKSKLSISSTAPRITSWVYAIGCWAKNFFHAVYGLCLFVLGFCTTCTVRFVLVLGPLYHVAYAWPITDFKEAANQFQKIFASDPYRIDDIDIYSNILYVTEDQSALSTVAHEFTIIDKDRPEICCLIGEWHLCGVCS